MDEPAIRSPVCKAQRINRSTRSDQDDGQPTHLVVGAGRILPQGTSAQPHPSSAPRQPIRRRHPRFCHKSDRLSLGITKQLRKSSAERKRPSRFLSTAFIECRLRSGPASPNLTRKYPQASRYFSNFDRRFRLPGNNFKNRIPRSARTGNTYHAFSGTTNATSTSI